MEQKTLIHVGIVAIVLVLVYEFISKRTTLLANPSFGGATGVRGIPASNVNTAIAAGGKLAVSIIDALHQNDNTGSDATSGYVIDSSGHVVSNNPISGGGFTPTLSGDAGSAVIIGTDPTTGDPIYAQ